MPSCLLEPRARQLAGVPGRGTWELNFARERSDTRWASALGIWWEPHQANNARYGDLSEASCASWAYYPGPRMSELFLFLTTIHLESISCLWLHSLIT